jgi:thiamine biosynthesis protein ThiI
MQFIIRLFPEITIKSPPVRKRWSQRLGNNLRIQARRIFERSAVVVDWDRIVLRVHSEDAGIEAQMADMLASTPGIAHFSRVHEYTYESVDDIYQRTLEHWQAKLAGKTFCVRVKRSGKQDFTSIEVERYIGGGLNQNTDASGVKLKNPDVLVHVEIKDETCYVVSERSPGLGGFPLGTQDDVLSLISGGFDSAIATHMLMRRGIKTHFCFFNLGGDEHELAVKEVAFYLWNRFGSSHRVKFISVPFEAVVHEIMRCTDPANMGVVLKRMMIRAAEHIADKGGWKALVTGEAISQVSSQTIHNLKLIESVSDTLILRPLIVMNKPDIIDYARQIGTETFSAAMPEYCGVISVRPSSEVNPQKLENDESQFDFSILTSAVESAKLQLIDEVVATTSKRSDTVPILEELQEGTTVIDIRHPSEVERRKLILASDVTVVEIPFYSLNTRLQELDRHEHYALYCDKGVMSRLHAGHLSDQGWKNVCVYRPEAK